VQLTADSNRADLFWLMLEKTSPKTTGIAAQSNRKRSKMVNG
jgi:hypothetical protein